jgi:hypothetical protein
MTLDSLIMGMGAFIVVLPFLGLPQDLDSALFLLAGIIVVALGVMVRRRGLLPLPPSKQTLLVERTFVDSNPTAARSHDEG